MDAILLIIGIVYGVCQIVIKSVQQCTYFLFSVNLLLAVPEMDGRQMRLISYSGDQSCSKLGSHWPNKNVWAIA
jgi:hypothetical protein